MPDNRLTVPAGPLGQLADPRPGPKTALSRPGRSRPCTELPRTPGLPANYTRELHENTWWADPQPPSIAGGRRSAACRAGARFV